MMLANKIGTRLASACWTMIVATSFTLCLAILSGFEADRLVMAIVEQFKLPARVTILYMSSWPILLLGARPFTNTLECFLLICLLQVYLSHPHAKVSIKHGKAHV